jgi:hypothetical protein
MKKTTTVHSAGMPLAKIPLMLIAILLSVGLIACDSDNNGSQSIDGELSVLIQGPEGTQVFLNTETWDGEEFTADFNMVQIQANNQVRYEFDEGSFIGARAIASFLSETPPTGVTVALKSDGSVLTESNSLNSDGEIIVEFGDMPDWDDFDF